MGATSSLLTNLIGVFVILPLTAGIVWGIFLAGGVFLGRVISWMLGKEESVFLYDGIEGQGVALSPPKLPQDQSRQKKQRARELGEQQRRQRMLRYVWDLIGVAALATEHVCDWSSSLILSQVFLFVYFALGITTDLFVAECNAQRTGVGIIFRGFFMSATLLIVIDFMSVAAWIAMP